MCKGIEALAGEGIRFTFTSQINNRNIDSLGFILDFAEKHRTKVVFQPIRVHKEDREAKSRVFFPTRERMQQALNYLLEEKAKGRGIASSANFLRQIKETWPDGPPAMNCWAGKLYCSVTAEGVVTACCDTLQAARKGGDGQPSETALEDFCRLPDFHCSTCYASTPLEANIAMSTCRNNPLAAIRQVHSFLPKPFWKVTE